MRNAPIESRERVPWPLGGQRPSRSLPWYRGQDGQPMAPEARALCRLVHDELLAKRFSLALDCHSGFGVRDRLWFPYAHSHAPILHLAETWALKQRLDRVHCHHDYLVDPQSHQYLTHGDLWDYAYLAALERPDRMFLPLTLEMGSSLWVKKNPRQLLSREGIFNPLAGHRVRRTMQRHLARTDFLMRAVASHRLWLPAGEARDELRLRALEAWVPGNIG